MEGTTTARIDYLRFVRRLLVTRWRVMALGFLAVMLPVVIWVLLFQPATYEATATLFLQPPDKSEPGFLREYLAPQANAMYIALLRSRSVAQGVAESISKESREELLNQVVFKDYVLLVTNAIRRLQGKEVIVYSPQEQVVRELQSARTAITVDKDGTVTLTAVAYSPRVAVDLANAYVEVLLARSSAYARQQSRATRELLENTMGQVRTEQQAADEALAKFQSKFGGRLNLPEASTVQVGKLAQLESALAELQVQKDIAQGKLAFLRGETPKSGVAVALIDPAVASLRDRLGQLQTQLAALSEKYTDTHPLVIATRGEVQDVQERLRAALAPRQAPKPTGAGTVTPGDKVVLSRQMAELEVELMSLQGKEELVGRQVATVRRGLSGLGARELEYANLSRASKTTQSLIGMLNEKLTAARITEQTQMRNIHVIDNATLPRQPSAKLAEKLLLLGLLGGLGLGVGLGFIRQYVAHVVETEDDVTASTGLPILGSVPGVHRSRSRLRHSQPSAAQPGAPALPAADPLPRNFMKGADPRSLHAEAFRAIRTMLQLQMPDRPLKTVLVTSPSMSEGKTTVLLNLGLVYVEAGRRVLLVDADLRRPSLHRALHLPNEHGLADVLGETIDWPHACRNVSDALAVMPSGSSPANPSSLLNSRSMETLLQRSREATDLVLIDAPPVLAVSDSLRLTSLVDAVILVVRAGLTQRRNLIRAKAQLEKVGATVAGVVINDLSSRDTRKYYGEYSRYARRGARPTRGGA
jgi:capsular exopolysaccharide synthesis family protein